MACGCLLLQRCLTKASSLKEQGLLKEKKKVWKVYIRGQTYAFAVLFASPFTCRQLCPCHSTRGDQNGRLRLIPSAPSMIRQIIGRKVPRFNEGNLLLDRNKAKAQLQAWSKMVFTHFKAQSGTFTSIVW